MSQEPSSPTWWRRAIRVGLLSFVLAVLVSYLSSAALSRVPAVVAFLVVLVLLLFGVVFDILGTSVTAAEATPLNSMAANKVAGAKQALWLVRNADRVANFCNDVVGDVTGAVAGAAGTTVALQLNQLFTPQASLQHLTGLAVIGLIAALNVGGKAAGKSFAISQATLVVAMAGRVISWFEKMIGRSLTRAKPAGSPRRRTT